MQVYRIYCSLSLPSKPAVKNKVQKKIKKETPTKKIKHDKCVAVNLLAIKVLNNSIMYSRFSLRFKEI